MRLTILLTLTLLAAPIFVAAQTLPSGVINVPGDYDSIESGSSIGSNTILNLMEGGSIGIGFEAGSEDGTSTDVVVNISGGTIDSLYTGFAGSTTNISGGVTRGITSYWFFAGSEAVISGGIIEGAVNSSGGDVTISGGTIQSFGNRGHAEISGGEIKFPTRSRFRGVTDITGGLFRGGLFIEGGSEVTIRGGRFREEPYFQSPALIVGFLSEVDLFGGEFKVNGVPYHGATFGSDIFTRSDTLTGVLEDGTPILIRGENLDGGVEQKSEVRLNRVALPVIDTTSVILDSPSDAGPVSIRGGQTLTVKDEGVLPDAFTALDASLRIEGGTIGSALEVAHSHLSISGGAVGELANAYLGSTVDITGGVFAGNEHDYSLQSRDDSMIMIRGGRFNGAVETTDDSELEVSGGVLRQILSADDSALRVSGGDIDSIWHLSSGEVRIEGGVIGRMRISSQATATVSGGVFPDGVSFDTDGTLNLIGTEFLVDGVLVDLEPGEVFTVQERDVPFSAILADGSWFELPGGLLSSDHISASATLTITLVPEPSTFLIALVLLGLTLAGRRS